jgi:hypothetical protein
MLTSIHLELMGDDVCTFFQNKNLIISQTYLHIRTPNLICASTFDGSSSSSKVEKPSSLAICSRVSASLLVRGDLLWLTVHILTSSNCHAGMHAHERRTATTIHPSRFGIFTLPMQILPFKYDPLSLPWSTILGGGWDSGLVGCYVVPT